MKIDVIIPHINHPNLLRECLELYKENCNPELTNVIVIDNGSDPPLRNDIYGSVTRNEDNLGMIKTLEQAKQISSADILIYTHSDTFYFEKHWDEKVLKAFQDNPKLGLLGIVGGAIATPDGGRGEMYCSFRNGHLHGNQTPPGVHFVALLDGCSMMFRRAALDSFKIDTSYYPHHFYDKTWSLEVLMAGWNVGVIAIDCVHHGGQVTIGEKRYQNWADKYLKEHNIQTDEAGDQFFYHANEKKYLEKWGNLLPIIVSRGGAVQTRLSL